MIRAQRLHLKGILLVLALALVFAGIVAFAVPAYADDPATPTLTDEDSGLKYTRDLDGIWITGSTKRVIPYLVIPKTIAGDPVIGISDGAFLSSTVREVVFVEGSHLATIGMLAFYGCTSLTSVDLPSSLTTIGKSAFRGCTSLTSVDLPSSLTTIDVYAFYGCPSLTSIDFPDAIVSIGNNAFQGCSSLAEIDIPDSVTSIGAEVFKDCVALTSVSIGKGIKSISYGAFSGCASLQAIDVPDAVTAIYSEAFGGCTSLASVTIGDSVTHIDNGTFSDCPCIDACGMCGETCAFVTYTSGLLQIVGAGPMLLSFEDCSWPGWGLPHKSYGQYDGYSTIRTVSISDSITSIDYRAFEGFIELTTIEIPASVTSIGASAFRGCTSLSAIDIPASVTDIGSSVFAGCASLETIIIRGDDTLCVDSCFEGIADGSTIYVMSRDMFGLLSGNSAKLEPDRTSVVMLEGEARLMAHAQVVVDYKGVYTSEEHCPAVAVTYDGRNLAEGVDYELIYVDNVNAGRATVVAKGLGSYVGFARGYFLVLATMPLASIEESAIPTSSTKVGQNISIPFSYEGDGELVVVSDDPSIARVSISGHTLVVQALSAGETWISLSAAAGKNYSACSITRFKLVVAGNASQGSPSSRAGQTQPAANSRIAVDSAIYSVLKPAKPGKAGAVAFLSAAGAKITIPAVIEANGATYKVTEIKARAFKGNKKIKKVVIGKNIAKIGKSAFRGCKKLGIIQIKTKKLTLKTVGAKAFAGVGAKVKVPKARKKVYRKLLSKRGLSKKAKVI